MRKREVMVVERVNLEVRRHFFMVRVGKAWNELPEEVKGQKSVNGFKNQYDRWRNKKLLRREIEEIARSTNNSQS